MQNKLCLEKSKKEERINKIVGMFFTMLPFLIFAFVVFTNSIAPTVAAGNTSYMSTVGDLAEQIVVIVGYIFRIIGVVMAVYAIATLIQAFQSNNPDAQARGAQVAIVAIILIFVPTIIKSFNLTQYLRNVN